MAQDPDIAKYQQDLHLHRLAFRSSLVSTEQKIQEDLDKAIISLSGGALGGGISSAVAPGQAALTTMVLMANEGSSARPSLR